MKKILVSILIGNLLVASLYASHKELFSYDNDAIDQELYEINELESYIINNQGVELNELPGEFFGIAGGLSFTVDTLGQEVKPKHPVFGIPSFCWGFCASVPGIILVHVITGDYEESKKAFQGCLALVFTYAVVYVTYAVILGYSMTYF
jgi:hypothetical protein